MKKQTLFALLVVLAVLATFGLVREFQFLGWDDNINVTDHVAVTTGGVRGLREIWSKAYANLYVPVAYTWFWALAAIARTIGGNALDPALFHGGNVILHALCALLVFRILRRILSSGRAAAGASDRAALGGALLFALHPLQVESVAWVTEARGLVSAAFVLAALDLWLAEAVDERVARDGARRTRRLSIATLCFVLAMLAKPQAAALPLVLVILDRGVLGGSWRASPRSIASRLALPAAWAVLALACVLLTKSLQGDETIRFVPPIAARPLLALDAIAFYLEKLVLPVRLAADYGRTPVSILQGSAWWLPGLVPVAVAATIRFVPQRDSWVWCFGSLVAALLPALGLVPFGYEDISLVADRYAYWALLGASLAAAFALRSLRPAASWAAIGGLALLLGVASRAQAETWRDDATLFARVLDVNPKSWKAHSNLGYDAYRRGKPNEAVREYEAALAANPRHALAHQNLGLLLCQLGKTDEGAEHLRTALEIKPGNAAIESTLGSVLLVKGKHAEAEGFLREALRDDPARLDARDNLANTLLLQSRASEAADVWRAAPRLEETPEAQKGLGYALFVAGDTRGAIEADRAALRLRPGWPDAESDLAWMLATATDDALRDGKEALRLAEHAAAPAKKGARVLDALAAAYAEVGRFDDAARTARAAIPAAKADEPALVPRIEARARLYEGGQPYHGGAR